MFIRRILTNRIEKLLSPIMSEDELIEELQSELNGFGVDVAARYARGNVSIQNKRFYLESDLVTRQ